MLVTGVTPLVRRVGGYLEQNHHIGQGRHLRMQQRNQVALDYVVFAGLDVAGKGFLTRRLNPAVFHM